MSNILFFSALLSQLCVFGRPCPTPPFTSVPHLSSTPTSYFHVILYSVCPYLLRPSSHYLINDLIFLSKFSITSSVRISASRWHRKKPLRYDVFIIAFYVSNLEQAYYKQYELPIYKIISSSDILIIILFSNVLLQHYLYQKSSKN